MGQNKRKDASALLSSPFISLVGLPKQILPQNILVLYLGQLLPGVKLVLEVLCDSKVVSVACLLPVAL